MNPLLVIGGVAALGYALAKSKDGVNDSGIDDALSQPPANQTANADSGKDKLYAESEPFPDNRKKDINNGVIEEILRTIGIEPDRAYGLPTRNEMLSYMLGRQIDFSNVKDFDFTADYKCITNLVFFRYNIEIRNLANQVIFARKAGESAYMWVEAAKKAGVSTFDFNGKTVDLHNYDPSIGLTMSAAELIDIMQNDIDWFVKDEIWYILSSRVDNILISILTFFIAWGETFGVFDLRNHGRKDSPKVKLGGYDAMLTGNQFLADEIQFSKANEARDWLYRNYFRYAGTCRISQLRSFLLANKMDKTLLKSTFDCFGADDYGLNAALGELKKEVGA